MKYLSSITLVAVGLVFSHCSPSTTESKPSESESKEQVKEVSQEGYEVGDIATDFSLKGTGDSTVSMADYQDAQGFILIFTCNHCPYAVAYEDRIIALHQKYSALGYPVVAVNPNDPEVVPDDDMANMKVRAEEKGFSFPYLIDEGQRIFPLYGATKTPHVYVLEKEESGLIVRYIGAIDNNYKDAAKADVHYVEDAVDALISGGSVSTSFTKAVGCSIKVKK